METTLTQEDYKNILALIALAPIKGGEAEGVVALVKKLLSMLEKIKQEPEEVKNKPNERNKSA